MNEKNESEENESLFKIEEIVKKRMLKRLWAIIHLDI